ncbi:MAG: hypothetical protein MK078_10845 [Crocinitomicaceae bacterium]|nr:hypothetical protein [Crocinitomicaceae bacterium]
MKKIGSFIIALFIVGNCLAQVTYAKPEEISEIKSRPLIVELLEKDQKLIDDWAKKKSKTKKSEEKSKYTEMEAEYLAFIDSYNDHIKSAIEKLWNLNEKVEYKTASEVAALRKSKSTKYSVLWFSESSSTYSDEFGAKYFPDLTIPTMNYSRIEKGKVKVDYSYFMHYTGHREQNTLNLSDITFSLMLMKMHLAEIEKTGNKKYQFQQFAKDQAEKFCKELGSKELIISEKTIHSKTSLSEIKRNYSGDVVSMTEDEISNAIEKGEDKIIGLCIPTSIAAGSAGPLSVARILYLKCFVNVSNGKIYTAFGSNMGEFNDPYYRAKEFGKYGKC